MPPTRTARRRTAEQAVRGVVSPVILTRGPARLAMVVATAVTAIVLSVIALGPLAWMVAGSFKSSQELLQSPPTFLPQQWYPENFVTAWNVLELPRYLLNTILLALGAVVIDVMVAGSAAYALSILRPRGTAPVFALIIATLFIPGTIIFIPLFVTVKDIGLLNNPLGVWLPGAASAFNVFILKRFFDQVPREVIEAARIDGANALQTLWHIVLPLSRPIVAVVAIFSLMASWKSFLWPMLVLPRPELQPVSVMLARVGDDIEIRYLLAALVISSVPVVILFLIFQRQILNGLSQAGVQK